MVYQKIEYVCMYILKIVAFINESTILKTEIDIEI